MLHFQPGRSEFLELTRQAKTIPVYTSLLSDQLTPVSAFERLAGGSQHAFLLESVVGGEKIARYSFLGANPAAVVTATGGDPLVELERALAKYRTVPTPDMPRFLGGAVGYAGYDIVRHYERLGTPPKDDRGLPDLQFGIYDEMVIFDHVRKLVHVVAHGRGGDGVSDDQAYDEACGRIEGTVKRLGEARREELRPIPPPTTDAVDFQSSFSREGFERAVERCKQYIRAGDIFQVVLSQRLSTTTAATPFDVYRALRVINPSPFMFYVQSPAVTLVGASPEILCRIEDRKVTSRPLAGTRPRGRTEAEDRGLETELLADPKERAEHVMLVDLGRNDLARVCIPGSVQVDDLMTVERYSHVMHICSNVTGTLADGKTPFDAVRSVLPVGTVSGAPKVRAMQIIDELEPVRRGPYGGAIGYVDFRGNMDSCIALRTMVLTPSASGGWRVDAQVGAGIVADSEPAREYQETLNKAQGMLDALKIANAWAM